jgi:hypothetical protein
VQTNGQRIGVIGSGVAGLIATYLLRWRFDVLLFESDDRLGVSMRDTEIKRFHVHAHPASGYRAHDGSMQVSYDMNRLTRLEEPRSHVVTLNPSSSPPSESVIANMGYQHPVYTPESVAAQRGLPQLSDGVCEWGAMVRLRYESTVVHVRRIDPPYSFAHPVCLWLIDLDAPPRLPWWLKPFARFDSRDHVTKSDPASIRSKVDAWLGKHGIDLHGGQVPLTPRTPESVGGQLNG